MKKMCSFVLFTTLLCLFLCSCTDHDDNSPILIEGDFKPVPEAFVTYEKAFEECKDTFVASVASSAPKEAKMVPSLNDDISQLRITAVEREIVFDVNDTAHSNSAVFQIYYGYFSNNQWHDMPADNYNLKTLHGVDSGYEDGWDALLGDHVIKMGQFVLLGFYNPLGDGSIISDSLGSSVLTFTGSELTDNDAYQIYENVLAAGTNKYDCFVLKFVDRYYIAIKYDDIPTDYYVTVKFYVPHLDDYTVTTYTYDDIMEALNRK